MPRFFLATLIVAAMLPASSCKDDPAPFVDRFGRCADFDELRQVYWGDTHVHTDLSFDANMQATRTTQDDAYAFARGQTIGLQPYTEQGEPTRSVTIDRPLDFVTLSDHAEFFGTLALCNEPGTPAYDSRQCEDYRAAQEFDADPADVRRTFVEINGLTAFAPEDVQYPALCGPNDTLCLEAGIEVWRQIADRADDFYDKTSSCQFTTFPGYEWSGGPDAQNLHRNVMFKNANVTEIPYSYFDEPYAEGLWSRLQSECLDADNGCDVLTIPHNSNISEGIYFERQSPTDEPFTREYLAQRALMEPVIEIYQHKGASECLPGETISDELCGFEDMPFANLAATNLEVIGQADPKGFLRYAYGEGMKLEGTFGVNPFEYGITAATDTHISAPGFAREADFAGHGGAGQPNRYLPPPQGFPDIEYLSPGGLTAVWAEENARDAIFQAFRRKETFGTSGPRIVVRLFGGWEYPNDLCDADNLAELGYAGGVPMGGTLAPRVGDQGPAMIVTAKQDPMGAPLQRIQIVKGTLSGDDYRVEVFDVAGNPDNGASASIDDCSLQGSGASDLCTVWRDPSFAVGDRAYYYARVIENPTCRWSTSLCANATYDCAEWDYQECQTLGDMLLSSPTCDCCDPTAGLNVAWCDSVDCTDPDSLPPNEARCCLPRVETTIQERAWSSPIWYRPPG